MNRLERAIRNYPVTNVQRERQIASHSTFPEGRFREVLEQGLLDIISVDESRTFKIHRHSHSVVIETTDGVETLWTYRCSFVGDYPETLARLYVDEYNNRGTPTHATMRRITNGDLGPEWAVFTSPRRSENATIGGQ